MNRDLICCLHFQFLCVLLMQLATTFNDNDRVKAMLFSENVSMSEH